MKRKIFYIFVLICVVALAIDTFNSYRFMNKLLKAMEFRRQALSDIYNFKNYLAKLREAESNQRGFIITGDPDYLTPYEHALVYLFSNEKKEFMTQQIINSDPQTAEQLQKLIELEQKRLDELEEVIDKRKKHGFEHAQERIADNSGKEQMDHIRLIVHSIVEEKHKILSETESQIKTMTGKTLLFFIIGDLVSVFFVSLCLFSLYKYINKLEDQERQLQELLAARQAILNAANYAIIATDINGVITSFNPAAEKMLGYSSKEMIGKTPEIFHDQKEIEERAVELSMKFKTKVPAGMNVFITLANQNQIDTHEWTYIHKNGSRFPVLLSIAAIKDEKGKIIGYLGIAEDISEKKEIERMKEEIITITSHELRSPVAAIKGALELLSQDKEALSDRAKRIIEIGEKNCARLTRLTDDLLDIQKIETGKLALDLKKINFSKFLSQVYQANSVIAQNAHVSLKYQPIPEDWIVEGDEDRLMQVINNLLSNAIKYSPEGGVVELVASQPDSKIRVEIKDQGPGIPKEFQSQIFQKFACDSSIANIDKRGSGLGLSIAKSLIEKQKGKIGFQTSPQGTTFWFELPLSKESEATI